MKTVNTLELAGRLLERYETVHPKVEAYYGLLAYYALAQAAADGNRPDYLEKCAAYLSAYPDRFVHPSYSFETYRAGGNGKAYLLYRNLLPDRDGSVQKYAELTLGAPVSEEGILCRRNDPDRRKIWIDTVYAVTPYLLYAGLALGEERYLDFAAEQCFKMYEVFLDETCGLVHQCRGFMADPRRITPDHWARGNGWCLLGLADLAAFLPEDSRHRRKAERFLTDLLEAAVPYQSARGLWRQDITTPLAWEESSGSALILYALGTALRRNLLPQTSYREVFARGIEGLAAYCLDEEFATYRSCPGCLCPRCPGTEAGSLQAYVAGRIPQKDEVHSYGCMMLAFTEAWRNGIGQVQIRGETR